MELRVPVSDPTGKEPRSELADWVELSSIVSASGSCGAAELRTLLNREEEREDGVTVDEVTGDELDEETLDSAEDEIENAVVNELEFRSQVLGDSYPFELTSSRLSWTLNYRGSDAPGRQTYLACLLISCMRDRRLKESPIRQRSGVDPARLFQAIATDAANALLGQSISFGWPRPDGLPFQAALQQFVDQLGVGRPKAQPPLAASRAVKDEGIDVIAWRAFADDRPGKLLLFGQVASGGNWRGKPVSIELPRFLDWFNTRPAEHPVKAMFIPFPQHHDYEPAPGVSWDDGVVDCCRLNEIDFGLIFDRLRLTELTVNQGPPGDAEPWIAAGIDVAREPA
jgi:hypothetical protein